MGRREISNTDDVIDSRDVIARIEELEELVADDGADEADKEELATLKALAEEASSSADWKHGETLIRDSYFEDYAEEIFDECYAHDIPQNLRNYIDYKAFARDLQHDYTGVEFGGITYYIRS